MSNNKREYGVFTVRFWADADMFAAEYGREPEAALECARTDFTEGVVTVDDRILPWRGAEIVPTPTNRAAIPDREALLRDYDRWHAARQVLSTRGNDACADEWESNDDAGIELLHDLVTKLRLTDECGHSSAEAHGVELEWTVTCPDCGQAWTPGVGQRMLNAWPDGHGNWHARVIEYAPGDYNATKTAAFEAIRKELMERGIDEYPIHARMEVEQETRETEAGVVTTVFREVWKHPEA